MLSVKWSSDFSEIKSLSFGPGQAKYEIPQNNHLFNNRSMIKAGGGGGGVSCISMSAGPPAGLLFSATSLKTIFKTLKKLLYFILKPAVLV